MSRSETTQGSGLPEAENTRTNQEDSFHVEEAKPKVRLD